MSLSRAIPYDSEAHRFLIKEVASRVNMGERGQSDRHRKWQEAEERILAYLPESELDAKRRKRRESGKPSYTTIQIPYSYALLMSAHTYWTNVFFARQPIHQVSGRHGETEQQTQALEALLDYQVVAEGFLAPYYIWLYDGGKYGLGVLGTYWDKKIAQYSTIEADEAGGKIQATKQFLKYEGNCVYNVSPFDFYPDPRVTTRMFQTGEFCAVRRRISWNEIVWRVEQGYYLKPNVDKIATSVGMADPETQSWSALTRPTQRSEYDNDAKHPTSVECFEVYVDLIQREWRLGGSPFPEKWVFTITSDKAIILGAQPLGSMHCEFPFDIFECEIEGYGQWTRGIPEIAEPIQNTMDWLINSHFYNVRAVLNNLFIADPTKVVMKDFENSEPGGIIRIKPEAFGTDINKFIQQVPIHDVTQMHMGDLNVLQGIGERMFGINDQVMGALTGSSRKTATEVRTTTGFSVNRQKTVTEWCSVTSFAPHARKLIMNSQQFYSAEMKLRIVGDLSREAGPKFLMATPESIAGFYDFVQVDGTIPVDKMAQVNLWQQLLVAMSKVPQVMMRYDLGRIFGWVAVLGGIKNLRQFELPMINAQMGSDEGLAREAEKGNVVPFPAQSDSSMNGISEPINAY